MNGHPRPTESPCLNGSSDNVSPNVKGKNDEHDFVLVELDEKYLHDQDHDMNFDDSYDYCDDVASIFYGNNEGKQPKAMAGNPHYIYPVDRMKDSDFTVPDVLMKDLDEAHEAAKLVQFDDKMDCSSEIPYGYTVETKSEHYSTASSVVSLDDPIIMEEDESAVSKMEETLTYSKDIQGCNQVLETQHETENTKQMVEEQKQAVTYSSITISDNKSPASGNSSNSASRTSNKKRRKKLKLIKKAQAAANAAQQLAEKQGEKRAGASKNAKTTLLQQQQQANNQKHKLRNLKKVSNIAVACATESMAAYREELIIRGVK